MATEVTWEAKKDLRWRGRKAAEKEEQEVDNYNKNNKVQPNTSNGEG